MVGLKIFKGLFDDKVMRILNIFVKNPEKQYYLSEVSRLSEVNPASTFRILNRLVAQDFLKVVLVGRVRMYQLAKGDKAKTLTELAKKEENKPLDYFISRIKEKNIEKVIEDSSDNFGAKLMLIGDFENKEIENICDEIFNKYDFKIEFVKLSREQFELMSKFKSFKDKKVIWEAI